MVTDSKYSDGNTNYLVVSDRQKNANDRELAKDAMVYYYNMNTDDEERWVKINENFDIHAGRWPQIENVAPAVSFSLQGQNINLGGGKLRHYPVADRVSKSAVGDIIMNPLIAVIVDNSAKGRNERERAQLDRLKGYLYEKEINPRKKQIFEQYYSKYGSQMQGLNSEEMNKLNAEVERQALEQTPEDIIDAMDRYRTPEQIIYQAFLNYSIGRTKAKEKFDVGGENAVVTAEEYYRLCIINGEPYLEVLNPKFVVWGGSEHCEFVEDATFAKYTQYLTPEDVIAKYGSVLARKDINQLSSLYAPIPGYMGPTGKAREEREQYIDRKVVDIVADNPQLQNNVDLKTKEGQNILKALYSTVSVSHRDGYGIKETYITWKWTRKFKIVRRKNRETGLIDELIRSEHYEKNPALGDIEVINKIAPQAWHGVMLGEGCDFFVNVEPLPFQYGSYENPYDVKLSIYGCKDNTFMNNTRNASLIDLAKPWQYRYNVLMKKLEEYEATDFGRVLLASVGLIPDNFTIPDWYTSLTRGKIGFVHNHNEGANPLDKQMFESKDLSNTADIAAHLQKLEYFEKKIYSSMYYNPVKAGNISPYATNANVAQSMQAADRQMLRFHNRRRIVKERVLTALLNLTLIAYKDNEFKKSIILDDASRAYFETNYESFGVSEIGLYVVDDYRETEKLDAMKQLALTLMQNGLTPRDLSAIVNADSMAEIDEILSKSERKAQKNAEVEHQRQSELIQQQTQARREELQWIEGVKDLRAERENETKLAMARENSMQMANAQDINRNQMNDSLERTLLEIQAEDIRHRREYTFKREELEKMLKIEEKKIKSKT